MDKFKRIAEYLRQEKTPKTPQEISNYTDINLSKVYNILKNNCGFFREVIVDSELKGWELKRV